MTIRLEPNVMQRFALKTSSARGFQDYNQLLTVRSTEGFVPHLLEPQNMDYRNLSARLRFRPIISGETASPK